MSSLDLSFFDSTEMRRRIEGGDYFAENENNLHPTRLRSNNSSADYKKFISLIAKIIDITNEGREEPISFLSYSSYKKSKDIKTPIIVYRTNGRTPSNEAKPRLRETVNDKENNNKVVNVYGQNFSYIIEFIAINSSDEFAEDTMSELEDILLTYAGFFLSHGVSNIRFLEQLPDDAIVTEEELYTKTLLYGVTLERITLHSEDKIRTIISRISVD